MLEAHDLAGQRGGTELFRGLSFRVDGGHGLVVTGRNGSGKTTLLRMLAGLTAPAQGELRWLGTPVRPFARALRAAVLYAGHPAALKDELSAQENLASLAGLAGSAANDSSVGAALDEVALAGQRRLPARVLSAGQRRRIGLARLRLVPRPLWLLDEPVTALDAAGSELLARLVRSQLERGGIVVAASHQPLDAWGPRVATLALDRTD